MNGDTWDTKIIAIGTCGLCGGEVLRQEKWLGTRPPPGRCFKCGAYEKQAPLPILEMELKP